MRLQVIIPLIILLIFSYLIFIFPFEVISSWLDRSTSLQETILSTAFVYLVCLYYFRSKSSNKIVKFFVYEGMGIGTISLFIVIFILIISLALSINDTQKIFIFFIIFFPSIIYGFLNAKNVIGTTTGGFADILPFPRHLDTATKTNTTITQTP